MEIKLSTVKKAFVVLLIVFAAVAAVRFVLPPGGRAEIVPTPTPDEGREAAVAGLTALFSVDVTEGEQAWRERFCSLATENGCAFAELFTNWDLVVKNKVRSEYRVQSAELYRDLGDRQVWMVTGVIRDLNTGEEKGGKIPVLVVREDGKWKFDHFLFDQELQALEEQS